jgi:hypothetical protein
LGYKRRGEASGNTQHTRRAVQFSSFVSTKERRKREGKEDLAID